MVALRLNVTCLVYQNIQRYCTPTRWRDEPSVLPQCALRRLLMTTGSAHRHPTITPHRRLKREQPSLSSVAVTAFKLDLASGLTALSPPKYQDTQGEVL
jgi:hypothetical protein